MSDDLDPDWWPFVGVVVVTAVALLAVGAWLVRLANS